MVDEKEGGIPFGRVVSRSGGWVGDLTGRPDHSLIDHWVRV